MSFKFTQNLDCKYFPCHEGADPKTFNCLFCYCPLFLLKDCGGNYTLLKSGFKNCTDCTLPHSNYDYILEKLDAMYKKGSECLSDSILSKNK